MKNTYTISSNPEYWGSDATEAEAETSAALLAAAITERFGVDVHIGDVVTERMNDDADPEGTIREWVNDNWTDFCTTD